MKECKNIKNKNYSGKENTPLGLGYHASGYEDGKRMKGKDKNYYKVKNGRWQKVLKSVKRNTRGFGGEFHSSFNIPLTEEEEIKKESKLVYNNFLKEKYKNSEDVCDYLANNLGNKGKPRHIYDKEMEKLIQKLNLKCNIDTKEKLINQLTSQFTDGNAPKQSIENLFEALE
jgi:hypothetical protein